MLYYPAVMFGHIQTFQAWGLVPRLRQFKLVGDKIMEFAVAPVCCAYVT
jgi:hypothetical protein